jgi:polysaccharide biosynthesis protein PslH
MAKIGVITSRFPYPLDKGDKLRIYNQIKTLSENNTIYLVCVSDIIPDQQTFESVSKFCKDILIIKLNFFQRFIYLFLSLFSRLPFQVALFYNATQKKKVGNFFKDCDAIYCHLIRVSEYVRDINKPKALDYMDAFSKGVERWHANANWLLKPILKIEHQRLLKYEAEIFDAFNYKVIITEQDKSLIPHQKNEEILVVPNGVDFDQYKPLPVKKKFDVLFSGNMGYVPNIDAAYFAATKIMPKVWEKNAEVSFLIAGIGAPEKIKKLANERIKVIENYEDINLAYSESRINIAPMFLSIGLQNKILQGMANRIPNISTTLANNAVKALHRKEIIEANSEEEFANEIVKLLNDADYYETIAKNGYEFVTSHYSWSKHNKALEKIILSHTQ